MEKCNANRERYQEWRKKKNKKEIKEERGERIKDVSASQIILYSESQENKEEG